MRVVKSHAGCTCRDPDMKYRLGFNILVSIFVHPGNEAKRTARTAATESMVRPGPIGWILRRVIHIPGTREIQRGSDILETNR